MTFYALLVGIDRYFPNTIFGNLSGAVRDIELVEEFLKKQFEISEEQIYKLVASTVYLDGSESLPTYKNIVQVFHHLTATAEPNDQIYIHYSGHGGKSATLFPELKGQGQWDESIVPMDFEEPDGQYLLDVELATLIQRMVDKELIVTLAMDSCHSGGATRGDCLIRGSDQVDVRSRPFSSLVASRETLVETWLSLNQSINALGALSQSRNYVFLAACRPSEFAYEYAANGYERNGAFTYWMIDTLRNSSSQLTYRALFSRINAKIQSRFPQRQLPMLIGDGNRYVFGVEQAPKRYSLTVLEVRASSEIRLSAGAAQGLSRGMRVEIYPRETIDFTQQRSIAIAEITMLEPTASQAKIVLQDDTSEVEQGAPAILMAVPVELMHKIRVLDHPALDSVRQALQSSRRLVEVMDTETAHYQVAISSGGTYEICAGLPIPNLRPLLHPNDPDAAIQVVKRLVHLARYQSVLSLDNPKSNLTHALEVDLLPSNSAQPFDDITTINIKAGEKIFLRIKNKFNEPLNIVILDLEPTWEISQIPVLGLSETLYSLQPNEERQIVLQLELPPSQDYDRATETIKIFAMLGEADFEWIILPPLDGDLNCRSASLSRHSTGLGLLLEDIGEIEKPNQMRKAQAVLDPCQNWVTQQITITVTR
jgi:hypothetical protein